MTRKPTHPGAVFLEDVMKPLNLSVIDKTVHLRMYHTIIDNEIQFTKNQRLTGFSVIYKMNMRKKEQNVYNTY